MVAFALKGFQKPKTSEDNMAAKIGKEPIGLIKMTGKKQTARARLHKKILLFCCLQPWIYVLEK